MRSRIKTEFYKGRKIKELKMKKRLCAIIFSCGIFLMACQANQNENSDMQVVTEQKTEETKASEEIISIETEPDIEVDNTKTKEAQVREVVTNNYSISLSNSASSTELKDITDERITINVPFFAYKKESTQFNESVQELINKELQLTSVDDDLELLTSDDLSDLYEYQVDYVISKAEEELFSIQYWGQLYTTFRGMSFSQGITINAVTGEKIPVEQYVKIDEHLLDDLKKDEIQYESLAGYEKEDILFYLEEFISDYQKGYVDEYSCFFLDESSVNLIISTKGGNSNYIVLTIPKTENVQDNFAECELTDEDFDVEYKGYTINRQTTAEELQSNLGVPEDFEDNNNGYIATVGQEWRWQIEYPDFANQSDIRVVFYTDLDTDETDIKMVALENVETYRGVKVGDTINTIYEKYGLPVEEKQSDSNEEYLELNYVKDDQRISFVIDEKNEMVKYIYIDYNLSEDEI